MSDEQNYGFGADAAELSIPVPDLPYRPQNPKTYRPRIGLVGCGGITAQHLTAYRNGGYEVVALCDVNVERARERRAKFCPGAEVFDRMEALLEREDIDVIDAATHPRDRVEVIEKALHAGKHVLSQKPFCLDLEVGDRLVALARERGLKLAVNHNGRWAPHWSFFRQAVGAGLTGRVECIHCEVDWDHNWIRGTSFEEIHHVLLYDFAIHWFDIVTVLFGFRRARGVYANIVRSATQDVAPPLLGQVAIDYGDAMATLSFDGSSRFGGEDRTTLIGERAKLRSVGPNLNEQQVTLVTADGFCRPRLEGRWDPDGFQGTMGELLCAIEEDREPSNAAETNLISLELAFAAIASADAGRRVEVGSVRRLEG